MTSIGAQLLEWAREHAVWAVPVVTGLAAILSSIRNSTRRMVTIEHRLAETEKDIDENKVRMKEHNDRLHNHGNQITKANITAKAAEENANRANARIDDLKNK